MKRALVLAFLAVAAAAVGVLAAGLRSPVNADTADAAALAARGAELAETVGRCTECHGAGQLGGGQLAYAGGLTADDWYAPAINDMADARLPWTAAELYAFLRTGSSPIHGVAVGPMSELVRGELPPLPDEDIEALAAYFAEIGGAPDEIATADIAAAMEAEYARSTEERRGEWLFVGYCVSCHFNKAEAQTGLRPELALNTAVSAPDPSNLIRVMLRGVTEAEGDEDAYMPGFAMLLSNRDVADIATYLRAAYAAPEDPWTDLQPRIAELRSLNDPMR